MAMQSPFSFSAAETTAETITGTDTGRVVTPAGLHGALAGLTDTTITAADTIIFADATDSQALKEDTVQGIIDLAGGGPTLGTLLTPTGETATFTGIPSGTSRININMDGLAIAEPAWPGSVQYFALRLGDAGGIETSGYAGYVARVTSSGTTVNSHYGDFELDVGTAFGNKMYGTVFLTLINAATYQWSCSFVLALDPGNAVSIGGGTKSLSAELTQLYVQANVNSVTGAFDAGTINISYD